jgi:hypothetical protein
MSVQILKNFYNRNNIYLMKYIKFDYKNINYHLIQCWKSNLNNNIKIFNIDFSANKQLNYIKINNLSINNDYYHNNKEEYSKIDKYNIILDNNLIINKDKFYVDIEMNSNKLQFNRIIIDDTKFKNNDYVLYNYNLEKILDNNEYKIIKKIIFTYLCIYANNQNINKIIMTIYNNEKRFNMELKEEGFKIDDNINNTFINSNNINIIKTI